MSDSSDQPGTKPAQVFQRTLEYQYVEFKGDKDTYQIVGTKPLGEGASGVVWHARGRWFPSVAVKLLLLVDGNARPRFLREVEVLGLLDHPNICRIIDSGIVDDRHGMIVLEFLNGIDVQRFIDQKREQHESVAFRDAITIIDVVLRALDFCHAEKRNKDGLMIPAIIHRDLKPSNIFLVGNRVTPESVKIIDFGIAKPIQPLVTQLTAQGNVVGTLFNIAPEQINSQKFGDVDARCDQFAIGTILYELLCGELPFGLGPHSTLMSVFEGRVIHPQRLVDYEPISQFMPKEVFEWLQKVLEPYPRDRFSSAGEAAEALERAAGFNYHELASSDSLPEMPDVSVSGHEMKLRETFPKGDSISGTPLRALMEDARAEPEPKIRKRNTIETPLSSSKDGILVPFSLEDSGSVRSSLPTANIRFPIKEKESSIHSLAMQTVTVKEEEDNQPIDSFFDQESGLQGVHDTAKRRDRFFIALRSVSERCLSVLPLSWRPYSLLITVGAGILLLGVVIVGFSFFFRNAKQSARTLSVTKQPALRLRQFKARPILRSSPRNLHRVASQKHYVIRSVWQSRGDVFPSIMNGVVLNKERVILHGIKRGRSIVLHSKHASCSYVFPRHTVVTASLWIPRLHVFALALWGRNGPARLSFVALPDRSTKKRSCTFLKERVVLSRFRRQNYPVLRMWLDHLPRQSFTIVVGDPFVQQVSDPTIFRIALRCVVLGKKARVECSRHSKSAISFPSPRFLDWQVSVRGRELWLKKEGEKQLLKFAKGTILVPGQIENIRVQGMTLFLRTVERQVRSRRMFSRIFHYQVFHFENAGK